MGRRALLLLDRRTLHSWLVRWMLPGHKARYACVQIPAQSLFHHVPVIRLLNLSASQLQKSTKKKRDYKASLHGGAAH